MSKLPFTYDRGSVRDADGVLVAEVFGTDAEGRQMAAASDLLASLKRLSQLSDEIYVRMSDSEFNALQKAWLIADAAIARAEGR